MYNSSSYKPFKELDKVFKQRRENTSSSSTLLYRKQCSRELDNLDDEAIFYKAMEDVKEIKEFRAIAFNQAGIKPIKAELDAEKKALNKLKDIVTGKQPYDIKYTQEYIEWCNPNLKANNQYPFLVESLHLGKYSVQDYLDLHGYTVSRAKEITYEFIDSSILRGYRCVKIIHGRGLRSQKGPLIKEAVIKWLCGIYRKHVIAFTSARSCDGGLGALYVLLKAKKSNR
ncbi:smr domain-containing protein [Candidatus Magnetoovum chiemensis]|nr:smr domain-containing protein [Candidatus Magnetoovum chiemensis]